MRKIRSRELRKTAKISDKETETTENNKLWATTALISTPENSVTTAHLSASSVQALITSYSND